MTFNDVIAQRYSCRSFSSQSIAQEKIDRILAAGRIAPTAVNKQPIHIWAVSRPETLEAIKGVTRSNYGAPLLLVVGCRPSEAWVRRYDGKNGAEVDAAIVLLSDARRRKRRPGHSLGRLIRPGSAPRNPPRCKGV